MGFERRGGAGQYFYLGRRTPTGKVVKEYYGRGPRAAAAARELARRRAQREAERQAAADARGAVKVADELAAEVDQAAELLMAADLMARGYHRVNYGPWRRLRHAQGGC